ncbi:MULTISPECIES: hypothetical protein [Haloferax]|uniref:Uncharacterized protein n=1 Tax=Haloferax sp. Atlit-48N TaxID=2077198 RepID=A0ACD5I5V3_9EURY|nr:MULTISPECIES: hypothetical protein [Haloferax]
MDETQERGKPDLQDIDSVSGSAKRKRPISLDSLLSAVTSKYRRAVLNSLTSTSNKRLKYDTLVDRVAEMLRDENTDRESDEHRQRVQIALHHVHLPKLAEVQMVDYETNAGHVQFVGGELEQDLLALINSHDMDK